MPRNMDRAGRMALDRIAVQMRAITDGAERRGTGTHLNSSERERWDRLNASFEEQEARVLAAEGRTALDDRRAPSGPRISDFSLPGEEISARELARMRPHQRRAAAKDPLARAFSNYLRLGIGGLNQEEGETMRGQFRDAATLGIIQNAQSTLVGTAGGYVVPQGFSDLLMEAMKWFGGIDGVVGEFETESGNAMPWPTVNDVANMGRVIGQNVQMVETDLVFNQLVFNSYILSSDAVLVPLPLMQDSYFDIDALVARLLGTRIGRLLNNQATLGSGSGTLTGIIPAVVASGNIVTLGVGNTASIAYGNLVDLEHSVDASYRYNSTSRFMFGDTMLKLLKKLVDGNNRPLWQPGISASFREGAVVDLIADRPTILGHQYVINQDMAVPAANAYSMLFGDMSTFKLRKVGSPSVMRLVERYADYLQVGFNAFFRCDSNLIDAGTHPIAVMQQSAS